MKKYGHRTLADILRSAPGLHVSYDRNYSFLGVRGFNLGDSSNNRVLLLWTAIASTTACPTARISAPNFSWTLTSLTASKSSAAPAPVYTATTPSSASSTSSRAGPRLNGVEVSGEAGSFDTFKGRISIGKQFTNGLELLLSGSILDSGGDENLFYKEYNTPANNNGIAHDADADASKNFFGSVSFHDFTLQGAWALREKNNPTAQYLADFNDNRLQTSDERSYASLKYAHEFPDIVDVTAQVYYDRHDLAIEEPFVGALSRRPDRRMVGGGTHPHEMAVGQAHADLRRRVSR